MWRWIGPLVLSFLTACSPLEIVDRLTPRTGYERTRDLSYGPDPRQSYDLYTPSSEHPKGSVLVFFYGGGWKSGDKDDYRFVGRSLSKSGYTVAIPDYRLYPQVSFPAFVEDGAAAVAAVAERLDRPIVLIGHSAGSHIAIMLTLDRKWMSAAGRDVDATVEATIGLSGPYDFLPLSDDLQPILAPDNNAEGSQPISYVRGDASPILLLHGTGDTTVLPRNTENLATALTALGGDVTVKTYPKVGHASMIGAFAPALRFLVSSRADVLAWLERRGL